MNEEATYVACNPYVNGIHGESLVFTARDVRDVRRALEHGAGFRTDVAERQVDSILEEAERIKALLAKREAA